MNSKSLDSKNDIAFNLECPRNIVMTHGEWF